jgi:hypothetical protein
MKLGNATVSDIYHVAMAMRDADYQEFVALADCDDRDTLARQLVARLANTDLVVAYHGNKPVAIGGAVCHRPNVATMMFYATDDFPKVGLGVTRFVKRQYIPALHEQGIHRLECVSHADHKWAHEWLVGLGFYIEASMAGFGKNGEMYHQFAKVKYVCTPSN